MGIRGREREREREREKERLRESEREQERERERERERKRMSDREGEFLAEKSLDWGLQRSGQTICLSNFGVLEFLHQKFNLQSAELCVSVI